MKSDNTIIRVEKRERYVVLDKYFLEEDDRLSWKATAFSAKKKAALEMESVIFPSEPQLQSQQESQQ